MDLLFFDVVEQFVVILLNSDLESLQRRVRFTTEGDKMFLFV